MRQKKTRTQFREILVPLMLASAAAAVVSLLGAYVLQCGLLPLSTMHIMQMVSIGAGAFVAGSVSSGAGKRGVMIGGCLALLWCAWTACSSLNSLLGMDMLIEMGLCILCSWIGSCIFHKNGERYTKRNRRLKAAR